MKGCLVMNYVKSLCGVGPGWGVWSGAGYMLSVNKRRYKAVQNPPMGAQPVRGLDTSRKSLENFSKENTREVLERQ